MGKIKTIENDEKFSFQGELRVLNKVSPYEFAVEIWVIREGKNNNNWDYKNLEKYYQSFAGTPILCAYVGNKIGDGHNMREVRDPETNEIYYSFLDGTAERIVGTILEDASQLSLKEKDGKTWLVAKGKLWSFYAPELVEKIVRTGRMRVSAETEVMEMRVVKGVEEFTRWVALGVTILGDDVAPAIPGARIAALKALRGEFEKVKIRAASLNVSKPKALCKKNKEGVKNVMNKQAKQRINEKFEGYKVVYLSDDSLRVGLIDSKGCGYTYNFHSDDNGEVITNKIKPCNLATIFNFGDESDGGLADVSEITSYVFDSATKENESIEQLRNQLETALQTIKSMQTVEKARRVQAIKDMLDATLEEIRQFAEEGDDDMEDEKKEIEENVEKYAEIEKDGAFCGDQEARAELLAKANEARLNRLKKQRAERHAFAWKMTPSEHQNKDDGIEGLLAEING